MTFPAQVVSILIASPGDTTAERDAVEQSIHQWNADRAHREGIVLLPLRWEVNAVPVMSDSPQAAINKQLLERADIVVGVFFSRLGQATDRYPSGTVEETFEASEAGKPVHVYFSTADVPRGQIDVEQLDALERVKTDLQSRALYGEFASGEELKVKVRSAIEHDLQSLGLSGAPTTQSGTGVALQASYASERETRTDRKGRTRKHTVNSRIVVTNHGTTVARGVRMSLAAEGRGTLPARMGDSDRPRDIAPNGGSVSYPLMLSMGIASEYTVTLTWINQSGDDESFSHSLSLR